MTTIVGVEGIDYAVLVADSQITEDNLITIATSTPKIIEVGKYLIGNFVLVIYYIFIKKIGI